MKQVIYEITKLQNFTNNMSLPVNALKYIRLFPLFYFKKYKSLVKINKYIIKIQCFKTNNFELNVKTKQQQGPRNNMEHTFWYTKNIGFFYSLLAFIEGAPNRWYNLAVIFKSSTWQSYVPVVMYLYSMKEKHTNISCPVTVHTKWVLAHFTIHPS